MHHLIDRLVDEKIIKHKLTNGKTKVMVIGGLHETARRLDFLYSDPEEYPFAILYFTGSKYFNTAMRQHALTLGFSLNEHGLYKMSDGKKGKKIPMTMNSEEDIFRFLGLKYVEPTKRIDSRMLIQKEELPIIENLSIKIEEKTPQIEQPKEMVTPNLLLENFATKGIKVLEPL